MTTTTNFQPHRSSQRQLVKEAHAGLDKVQRALVSLDALMEFDPATNEAMDDAMFALRQIADDNSPL